MTNILKRVRYFWWFLKSFVLKNLKLLIFSSILSFFAIFLFINFIPVLNTIFFKRHERIGMVGKYSKHDLDAIPIEITSLLSNPLISVAEKGELIPVLASSWEIIDERIYRVHLKPNLYWSDNKRFKASDADMKFRDIKVKAIDETTLEFQLKEPLSNFPIYLTKPILGPQLKGVAGLYRVQSIRIENNNIAAISLYPNQKDQSFKTYYFYSSDEDLIAAFKKGEITIFSTRKNKLAQSFKNWKNTTISKKTDYSRILTVFFNAGGGITSERDVRKALIYAIPDFQDLGEKATGPIPPTSWGYSANVRKYNYDLDRASELISKTKVATNSATINIYTFYDYVEVAEAIKKKYDKLNLKSKLKILSYFPDDFDILITLWSPPTDPDQYYLWHSKQIGDKNITKYKNLKVDKLLEDGRKKTDIEERLKLYQEFQKVLMDDAPAYFLYHPYIYVVERK